MLTFDARNIQTVVTQVLEFIQMRENVHRENVRQLMQKSNKYSECETKIANELDYIVRQIRGADYMIEDIKCTLN